MMKRLTFGIFSLTLSFCSILEASVFLYNDSPYKLKAVVVAANGTTLGEKVLKPQETGYFEDSLGQSDPTSQQHLGQPQVGTSQYPIVPYTVFWYCIDGSSFSTCENIAAGALSSPNACEGPRFCKRTKKDNQQQDDDYSED